MSANLKEKISEAVKIKSLSEIVKRSNERFKPKIFAEKYLSFYRGTPIIRLLFSLFSVVTGICFFLSISENMNFYFSLFLGVLLYSVVEILKGKMIRVSLTEFLQKEVNIISVFSAFFGVVLFSMSVFCSVKGAESLYTKIDTSKTDLKEDYKHRNTELTEKYELDIKELKRAKNKYIEQVSYRGKINIHNSTNKTTLANYETRISEKEAERKTALKKIELEQTESLTLSSQKANFDTETWIAISVFIEVSILFCLIFISVYEFKAYSENELLEMEEITSNKMEEFKPTFKLKNQAIGFQKNQVETSRNNDLSENRQVLEFMIKKGINDFKVLSKLGFNFKQIASVLEKEK